MDQKFNTSFIPKKFLSDDVQGGSASKYVQRRSVVGPGYFIAILIFIATVGASITIFAYTKVTERAIAEVTAKIQTQMEEVKSEDLTEFLELERQIHIARTLLDGHVAVSEILHKLEEKTLHDVQYVVFDYRSGNQAPLIILGGQSRTLANIALQVHEIENDTLFVSPTLTRLERDNALGLLSFDVQTSILPELVSYNVAVREGRHGNSAVSALPTKPATAPVVTPTSTSSTP